ncbi:MAG: hypothetical protein ACPGOY_18825 [Rhodospirillaceae bacterium]
MKPFDDIALAALITICVGAVATPAMAVDDGKIICTFTYEEVCKRVLCTMRKPENETFVIRNKSVSHCVEEDCSSIDAAVSYLNGQDFHSFAFEEGGFLIARPYTGKFIAVKSVELTIYRSGGTCEISSLQ